MSANETQVGGDHYRRQKIQHWDYAAANEFDYFQGQITKYVSRWKTKNGLQDLEKALHFLQKYVEVVRAGGFSDLRGTAPGKPMLSLEELVAVSVEKDTAAAVHAIVEGWHPTHQMSTDTRGRHCRRCSGLTEETLKSPCRGPESARKGAASYDPAGAHDWSIDCVPQCWKCGQFRSQLPTPDVCPQTYPYANRMQSCCECGEDYPAKDLVRDGEIYCQACRDKENVHYYTGPYTRMCKSEVGKSSISMDKVTCAKCRRLLMENLTPSPACHASTPSVSPQKGSEP